MIFFNLESHACADLREALVPLPCGDHSRSVRPRFLGLSGRLLARRQVLAVLSPRSCSEALHCDSPLADQAKPLSAVWHRSSATRLTPAGAAACLGLVPRGQRAPLNKLRACL